MAELSDLDAVRQWLRSVNPFDSVQACMSVGDPAALSITACALESVVRDAELLAELRERFAVSIGPKPTPMRDRPNMLLITVGTADEKSWMHDNPDKVQQYSILPMHINSVVCTGALAGMWFDTVEITGWAGNNRHYHDAVRVAANRVRHDSERKATS